MTAVANYFSLNLETAVEGLACSFIETHAMGEREEGAVEELKRGYSLDTFAGKIHLTVSARASHLC